MRQIEFRAWDKRFNTMDYGRGDLLLRINNKDFSEPMQFTGLLDKNGVKIFEGDVVRSYGSSAARGHKYGDKLFDHVVEYGNGGFEPFIECGCTSSWTIDEYEVIGNIYESGHLLGDKNV